MNVCAFFHFSLMKLKHISGILGLQEVICKHMQYVSLSAAILIFFKLYQQEIEKGFSRFSLKLLQEKEKKHLFNNDLSKRNSAKISISLGDCRMKNSWIFFKN